MRPTRPLIVAVLLSVSTLAQVQTSPATQAPTPAVQSPAPETPEALHAQMETMQKKLNDWPNLARFAEANAALRPPAHNEKRVVFMGDSITQGWKLDEAFPGRPYVNRGISGQTTPQMLIRFRPDVVDLKPTVVVILAGTNDIGGNTGRMTLEQIEANLASMVDIARVNGIHVVLSSVMPVYASERRPQFFQQRPPEKILALNNWIRAYCERMHIVYLDYFSAMAGADGLLKRELSEDGLHPNAAGHKIMAPLAEAAIAKAVRQKVRH
jgi:lysophospholipase L1-like esterase